LAALVSCVRVGNALKLKVERWCKKVRHTLNIKTQFTLRTRSFHHNNLALINALAVPANAHREIHLTAQCFYLRMPFQRRTQQKRGSPPTLARIYGKIIFCTLSLLCFFSSRRVSPLNSLLWLHSAPAFSSFEKSGSLRAVVGASLLYILFILCCFLRKTNREIP